MQNYRIFTLSIIFNVFISSSFCAPNVASDLYGHIEIYNGTDENLYIDGAFLLLGGLQSKALPIKDKLLLKDKTINTKFPSGVDFEDKTLTLEIYVKDHKGNTLKTFKVKNFTKQSNVFVDIKPISTGNILGGIKLEPYSPFKIIGYKKSRMGNHLIHNVTKDDISSKYGK